MEERPNLLDFDRAALAGYLEELGERRFRATQLIQWLHRHGVDDFLSMTDIGRDLRERLQRSCRIEAPTCTGMRQSADGVRKWAMRLFDGDLVETVFIPEARRGTLCVSSQVGCPLACRFCATGMQGFRRNLEAAEIVGQLRQARAQLQRTAIPGHTITNVVLMGMGEPLLNLDRVLRAVNLMLDPHAYGLARRRVTISTAGVAPAIERLGKATSATLAISLHAADNRLRDRLVPLNRSYPLERLLSACRRFVADRQGEAITFEYTMLHEINDSPADARRLARLLNGLPCKMNLIPFNSFSGAPYRCSPPETMERFKRLLMQAGYIATIRKTRGDGIDAACGQLIGRFTPRARGRANLQCTTAVA